MYKVIQYLDFLSDPSIPPSVILSPLSALILFSIIYGAIDTAYVCRNGRFKIVVIFQSVITVLLCSYGIWNMKDTYLQLFAHPKIIVMYGVMFVASSLILFFNELNEE